MRVERKPADLETPRPAATEGLREERGAQATVASPHMRDLAALLALPRMWRDRDPAFIVGNLVDVLVSLLRLDAAYVNVVCDRGEMTFEFGRPAERLSARELGLALHASESDDAIKTVSNPMGTGTVRRLRVVADLGDQHALVALGSHRADFPTDVESFLAGVAVEQAMLAVHASRLVSSLKAANSAKATFLATMSHELRTPLNAIIGYSELLRAQIGGQLSTQQEQHVQRIEVAARHLMGLIEGILSFARLEAGKEQVHLADADAVQLAEGVVSLVEPLSKAKHLTIRVNAESGLPMIRTDLAKVRQILINLLSNAVKFSHQGTITIDVSTDAENLCWTVTDTGIGIAAGDLDRIFEPFQQVIGSHAGRAAGTGLGLSVSRQLARLLGGDVTAESAVAEGSSFTLRLPLLPERAATAS